MTQKVLVTYGDSHGPKVIRAAERVLRTVAPELDLYHARIGADAYHNTSYALPSETIDLVAECDAILSGPVDMAGIPERDPLATIKKQMGLFLEYGEFSPLCSYLGNADIGAVVLSPTIESALNVYETESLDGVASEYYTSVDTTSKIFSRAMYLAEKKRRTEVRLVSDNVLYPIRERLIRESFHRHFAATEFNVKDSSTTEILFDLAHETSSIDVLICDIHSATCIWGLCSGLVGGSGLMPHAFLGARNGLYISSPVIKGDAPGRELNPTSAILSAAVMLLNLGNEEGYRCINKAVREMYRMGRTTPDVGGKLKADAFAKGVCDLIGAELQL